MSSETKTIKCVCVGDGTVGKTCMLISYTTNSFPTSYIPTVFDNYSVTVMISDEPYTLALFDTSGQEGFEYIRSISYSNTDVFLVCYSVMSPSSFTNAQKVWIPEIRRSNPKTPFVLVGTKIDLRRNEEEIEKLAKSKMKSISREQGEKMAKEFHAYAYIECSALTQENLEQTFHNAISATIERNKKKTSKQLPCCNCALL